MKGSSTWHFYSFVLFLVLAFGQSNSTGEGIWGHKYFVRFINNINGLDVLNFTCKSDSDTIERQLEPNFEYEFKFRLTLGTLWTCWTSYQSISDGRNYEADFIGYRAEDVPEYHGVHAIWSVRDTGIWLHNDHSDEWTLKHHWGDHWCGRSSCPPENRATVNITS